MKALISFVPVLHEGYRKFFDLNKDADVIFILGEDIIAEFPHLAKEIRMLEGGLLKKAIESWGIFKKVDILEKGKLEDVKKDFEEIVMPDEDVCHELAEKYFFDKKVSFAKIFLRWDKHNSVQEKPITADVKISSKDFDKKMIEAAKEEAGKSSDNWRHVGSIVIKDGVIILKAHNSHVPSEHTPYINGDPRNNFHKGDHLELSSAIHSEAKIIAEAAEKGISLSGAEIYVSTFPCPPCAKLIAYSGIKKIYYRSGYGVLDGEDIMKSRGVEIIFVGE